MKIILPDWYDDLYEFECESKGCVLNFTVSVNGQKLQFNFYDIVRFAQEAKAEIKQYGYYKVDNAIIINKVTRKNIINFLQSLEIKPEDHP